MPTIQVETEQLLNAALQLPPHELDQSKQMEQFDVERLQHLDELAQLRGISLPDLMQQLGLNPPEPEYD